MNSMVASRAPTEQDVVEAADALFRERGYSVVHQLRIRSWRPDLVAVRGNEVVIVEAKGHLGDLRKAVARTALYATDGSAAYLALPSERVSESLREIARTLGIGLIEVDEGAKVAVKAPIGRPRPALLNRARRAVGKPSQGVIPAWRPRTPPLGRVLRHRRLIETLLVNPKRRFTIRELSMEARTPYATTWRMVEELKALGALTSERVGTCQYLSVNVDSPLVKDLEKIRSLELSPHRSAAREFARRLTEVPQVKKAVLFGSVAEGRETPGSDVDIAVVLARRSKHAMDRVYAIVSDVQDRTGMKVVPLAITAAELRSRGQLGDSIRAGEVLYERP
ncbi:MAG: nucleotidyltransferase domain-containing protein [Thermoplasmata archaeon]